MKTSPMKNANRFFDTLKNSLERGMLHENESFMDIPTCTILEPND